MAGCDLTLLSEDDTPQIRMEILAEPLVEDEVSFANDRVSGMNRVVHTNGSNG